MELEVVWNGSHGHADADLLCCERILRKRLPPAPTRMLYQPTPGLGRPSPVKDAVILCLSHAAEPVTMLDLMAATGFERGTISSAIRGLRLEGRVRAEAIPGAQPGISAACVWYRWIAS